ncbi:MAG: branched-chain amino acid ABC transporter permease [Gammaproteobacteria bacterium]|nr:branched-chain amino acid ABC transporter permease [Gammaproteobacteria bacterium]
MENEQASARWRNPLKGWQPAREVDEVPTDPWRNPVHAPGRYTVKLFAIGRLRFFHKFRAHGKRLWHRTRYWPTRRRVLDVRGGYNPKTLAAEKTIRDKRPLYWLTAFACLLALPLAVPDSAANTLYTAAAIFGIYGAINLCWMLIIGTAGVSSLATYSVVGAAAYGSAYCSIHFGMPWWALPFIGVPIGLVFGLIIALPATRLDGFYYALLTLGLNELCRTYVLQSKVFGSATGGLYGAQSYIPDSLSADGQLLLGYYASLVLLVMALALYRTINGRRLGRILRMAPEQKEAFAEACGIDYRRARIQVFLLSSMALGFIGGFYAAHFRGASPSLFSIDTVALGLAMLMIGGMQRAEGAVLGTFIVVGLHHGLVGLGPLRLILIGVIMLAVVLFLRGGLFGIKPQFRAWRDKKKSENRSTRSVKGGEMLPEEATETFDKDEIYRRRFDKQQRDFLKTLVTAQVIEEHRRQPLGQHSEALERLLMYFRRHPQQDKYAIEVLEPFKAYRIVALSGHRGVAPHDVEEKIYASTDDAYHGVFMRRVQDLLES